MGTSNLDVVHRTISNESLFQAFSEKENHFSSDFVWAYSASHDHILKTKHLLLTFFERIQPQAVLMWGWV